MYRQYILKELQSFLEERGDYTVGQIFLSIINAREEKNSSKSEWLIGVTDEDFYTAIQNAKDLENE